MNKSIYVFLAIFSTFNSTAYGDWQFYEETEVKGSISGTIKKETIIQVKSGSIYQVSERTRQRVRERNPETLVLRDGEKFKLLIEGFDEPLICVQLVKPKKNDDAAPKDVPKVVESKIDGDFEGWEGETIFKLDNGQIWQQSKYAYTYHYAYSPEVMIININGTWKMKVKGVDDMIEVKQLK